MDEQKSGDYVETNGDITFIVEEDLLKQYKGFEIDYLNRLFIKGFQVRPIYGEASC